MEKPRRRRADAQNAQSMPVRLVIWFVGSALLLSLLIYAALRWAGQEAGDMTNIILPCITGLLALLGRTNPAEPQGPTGAPADPVNIAAPPNEPVNVTETPATPDAPTPDTPKDDTPNEPTVDLDDDGGDDLTDDSTSIEAKP